MSIRSLTCTNTQYAIRNTQHATRNTQHATRNTQHALCLPLIAILSLSPYAAAKAGVIYDNGASDLESGQASDFDFLFQAADDFSLSSGSNTITDIHWFGVYAQGNTVTELDNFTLRIFEDIAGVPELNPTVLDLSIGDVGRIDTGDDVGVNGFDQYAYSVDIAALTLTANTTYWLSIVNNTVADTDDNWFWSTSDASSGNVQFRINEGNAWANINFEMAFSLTDDNLNASAVPVPGALWLFAPALGLLARRRKNKS